MAVKTLFCRDAMITIALETKHKVYDPSTYQIVLPYAIDGLHVGIELRQSSDSRKRNAKVFQPRIYAIFLSLILRVRVHLIVIL